MMTTSEFILPNDEILYRDFGNYTLQVGDEIRYKNQIYVITRKIYDVHLCANEFFVRKANDCYL